MLSYSLPNPLTETKRFLNFATVRSPTRPAPRGGRDQGKKKRGSSQSRPLRYYFLRIPTGTTSRCLSEQSELCVVAATASIFGPRALAGLDEFATVRRKARAGWYAVIQSPPSIHREFSTTVPRLCFGFCPSLLRLLYPHSPHSPAQSVDFASLVL